MALNYTIIYGSVRHHRQGIRTARFIENKVKERGYNVNFIDPLEYHFPLLDRMYKEFDDGEAPGYMKEVAGIIENSDAIIIVTGEYNHSIPPALKNLLDHYQKEYLFKPAAIASYSGGSFGGVRAAVHVRAILGELGMPTISSMFPVPRVSKAFEEDGTPIDETYHKRIQKFLNELEWYARALKDGRANYALPL